MSVKAMMTVIEHSILYVIIVRMTGTARKKHSAKIHIFLIVLENKNEFAVFYKITSN
jgi:hypothetical protein